MGTIALATPSLVKAARPLTRAKALLAPVSGSLLDQITAALDDAKAEEIVTLDLGGQSSIADYMVVASGRSDRHVGSIADRVVNTLKEKGHSGIRVEGMQTCEWVLIDAGDVIVHVFKPDARGFYNIERLWGADRPNEHAKG